jgi:hypothetical protein
LQKNEFTRRIHPIGAEKNPGQDDRKHEFPVALTGASLYPYLIPGTSVFAFGFA